jgi:uncharacterized protein YndB with AHSA1/START domain
MPAHGHAVLEDHDGRWALRFERTFDHPPARVWRALTSHDELLDWHPTPFDLEPRSGGHVSYSAIAHAPEMPRGRVLAFEPPHLLAYTWGEDELRWELRASDGGCVLSLTHVFDDRFKAARDAAGWEQCLDALSSALAAEPRPQRGSEPRLPPGWHELNAEYEERFGITHGQATPPPRS